MEYQLFLSEIKSRIKESLPEKTQIQEFETMKNNGEIRKGFLFRESEAVVSPVIYMEEYYIRYNCGSSIAQITEQILAFYNDIKNAPGPEPEIEQISDFNIMKGKIVFRLINRERNRKLLADIPNYPFQDLAIVFYVLFDVKRYHAISMMITMEHLKIWGKSKEEVWNYAKENTPKLLPPEIQDIHDMLKEFMAPDQMEDNEQGKGMLFVLTNEQRNYGASALIYPGILEKVGEIWKENFYILPSSVHEVILVPESKSPSESALKETVCSINRTDVEQEEWLSDSVYYFQREKKEVFNIDIIRNLC